VCRSRDSPLITGARTVTASDGEHKSRDDGDVRRRRRCFSRSTLTVSERRRSIGGAGVELLRAAATSAFAFLLASVAVGRSPSPPPRDTHKQCPGTPRSSSSGELTEVIRSPLGDYVTEFCRETLFVGSAESIFTTTITVCMRPLFCK